MPSLRQLRALRLLSRNLSFTRTSEQLSVTQSAVSVMIRDLESELGTPLIVRGRTPMLTPAGEAMADCAQRCLDDIDATVAAIASGGPLRSWRLTIAAGHVSAATFLPEALRQFTSLYPQTAVKVVDCPVARVSQLVATGEADAGIGALDADPAISAMLKAETLFVDRLWAVTLADASRRRQGTLPWKALDGQNLLLVGRARGRWRDLFVQLNEAGVRFQVSQEVSVFPTALEMVRQGLGVALLPGFVVRGLQDPGLSSQPLGRPSTRWPVHWLTRSRSTANPVLDSFRQTVQKVLTTNAGRGAHRESRE